MTATDRVPGAQPDTALGYAYTWDVNGDPAFVERVGELEVSRVAVAAAYHTVRAATPFHPETRLVDARTAALYRPIRPEAWEGRRLVPAAAEWVSEEDPFASATDTLAEAGFEVAAWVVLTHSSRLGTAYPELAVENCFGEHYPYALCPQAEEVREYAVTLTSEVLRDTRCSAVVLEACGQLGIQHGGHHDKTDGAYDAETLRLLSICCCAACRAAWQAEGLEPAEVVATLRTAVEARTVRRDEGPATSATAPPGDLLDTLLRVRHAATDALRRTVIDAARAAAAGRLEVILHSQPDPWATGALPGLTPTAADDVDVVVAQCWATGEQSVQTARRLAEAVDGRAVPASYVTVLPPTRADEFGPHLAALEDAGSRQNHLYHLGLAGPDRQQLLAEATRAASEIGS